MVKVKAVMTNEDQSVGHQRGRKDGSGDTVALVDIPEWLPRLLVADGKPVIRVDAIGVLARI